MDCAGAGIGIGVEKDAAVGSVGCAVAAFRHGRKVDAVAADSAAGAAVTIVPGIVVRRRTGAGEPQYAIIHPFSTETYYIVEGTGSLVTGGILDPPPAEPVDPDVIRSKAIKNGVTHKVAKGDVIVVPPGTPHWFNAIDGTITYLESRARVK